MPYRMKASGEFTSEKNEIMKVVVDGDATCAAGKMEIGAEGGDKGVLATSTRNRGNYERCFIYFQYKSARY